MGRKSREFALARTPFISKAIALKTTTPLTELVRPLKISASARRAAWLPPVDLRLTDAAALRCHINAGKTAAEFTFDQRLVTLRPKHLRWTIAAMKTSTEESIRGAWQQAGYGWLSDNVATMQVWGEERFGSGRWRL